MNNHPDDQLSSSNEIDILEILNILFDFKWIIFTITSLAAVISVLYSLSLPNIYHSQAVLVSQDSANSNSTNAGGIGSLASLAGVSITESTDSNSVKAMEKIQSFSFYEQNILPNIFLPELMAIEKWNASSNTLVFDQSLYDSKNNKWVRNYSYPRQLVPSAQESFKVFKNHFSISDSDSGFITIRIKHQSPFVAKKWIELLINEINTYYRSKDRENAEKSINFLNEQLVKTKLTEVKQVFATLLQQETQKLMLTQANESYVFEFLDPPIAMEIKSEPNRDIICIIGTIIGFCLAIIYALVRHYFFKNLSKPV